MSKNKSWFRRHWLLTGLGVILLLLIIGSAISEKDNTNTSQSQNNPSSENNQNQETSNDLDIWSKSSGYNVDECYEVCDGTYDIQTQVTVCQGNCNMIGKPGTSLDKYVNTVKDIKNK